MRNVFSATLIAVLLFGPACRPPRDATGWSPRFGPVIGNDAVVGRTYSNGRVVLLSDRPALITIDLRGEWAIQRAVSNRGADVLWGLAHLNDGTIWTLAGQRALGKIEADGRIAQRIPLAEAHVGLFSRSNQLVYQVLNFHPPADALVTGPPGERSRRPWSSMQTRRYPLSRAAVAALNLVSCGGSDTIETPCWFPDEAAVTLVNASGGSRRVILAGLPVVAPEVLLTSDNPARPVRDVFVAASRDLWVLGSGAPARAESAGVPGGRLLVRYDSAGRLTARGELRAPVRMILGATANRCLVLAADGHVVEVRP